MRYCQVIVLLLLASTVLTVPLREVSKVPLYLNPRHSPNDRADDLVKRMTLDEKIGQMTQVERNSVNPLDILKTKTIGSILSGGGSAPNPNTAEAWADMIDGFQKVALQSRLKIPILYGSDAVHGHNNLYGAVLFPHNIGIGCSRNASLAQTVAQVAATEIAGSGVQWTFAPCIATPRNERWGRTYEGFGEDPSIGNMMATMVTGLQTATLGSTTSSVLATAKHWVGDGGTTGGKDQGNTEITEAELRKIHMPPYLEAIKRGVGSVMISFNSINGTKCHGNAKIINGILKDELKFQGFTVSDWMGIDQLSGDYAYDVRTSINAGLDMIMVPNDYNKFIDTLRSEVQAGRVPISRVDDAATRILRVKFQLGLFERPFTDRALTKTVGSKAHRDVARDAVRQSLVVLKNEGILPLSKNITKLFVAGKNADDMGLQCGGWSITWQGGYGPITPGTTILQGIKDTVSPQSKVTYDRGANGLDSTYDAVIVIVGETPYAEGRGDKPDYLGLENEDLQTLDRAKNSGVPVITVLISGRPMIITDRLPAWKAFVAAWLPGTEGTGIAEVLFGMYKPTGKLSHTWPKTEQSIPINVGDAQYDPLFPFGHGLTYK